MRLKPLRNDLEERLQRNNLLTKWKKVARLFEENLRHPSLHVELLEPKWRGIYSFRLDRKFRALFFITPDGDAEVFQITNHYR